MDTLYMIIGGDEWEDMKLLDNEKHAFEYSAKYPQIRVEEFKKNEKGVYLPTYNYFKDGMKYENK